MWKHLHFSCNFLLVHNSVTMLCLKYRLYISCDDFWGCRSVQKISAEVYFKQWWSLLEENYCSTSSVLEIFQEHLWICEGSVRLISEYQYKKWTSKVRECAPTYVTLWHFSASISINQNQFASISINQNQFASICINQHQSMKMCQCHYQSKRKSIYIGINAQNTIYWHKCSTSEKSWCRLHHHVKSSTNSVTPVTDSIAIASPKLWPQPANILARVYPLYLPYENCLLRILPEAHWFLLLCRV